MIGGASAPMPIPDRPAPKAKPKAKATAEKLAIKDRSRSPIRTPSLQPAPARPAPAPRPDSEPPAPRRTGRLPINLQRKVDRFEDITFAPELQRVVNNLSAVQRAKRANMHAQEAARGRTAPPAGSSTDVSAQIEQSGAKPAQDLSPRLRKEKVKLTFGGAISKQRTETGAVARYNRR